MDLRVGDWVEVRDVDSILATLDSQASLGGLPFMPEMLRFCGERFRVFRSAHKTCTPPSLEMRRLDETVHLEGVHCDGAAHGGCQAACLLFWKEAWLRPVPAPEAAVPGGADSAPSRPESTPVPEVLLRATRRPPPGDGGGEELYRCQSTDLPGATRPARWWDPRLLWRDLASGNVGLGDFVRYVAIAALNAVLGFLGRRSYPFMRPRAGPRTPTAALGLQAGETVEVRSADEIMATLDDMSKNRGLRFDVEMLPYAGKSFSVRGRADKFIDEEGRMIEPRGTCLILEGVVCGGGYSKGRIFCSRNLHPFWHEVWLKRVARDGQGKGDEPRP